MRLEIKAVTPSSEIRGVVVLEREFAISARLEERTRSCRSRTHLRHLAETITITVISTTRTMRRKDVCTDLAILTHHRGVEIGMDIVSGMFIDHAGIGEIEEITDGFLRDDIHYSGDRIGSIHSRTTSSDHLYTVNHRRRNLLQTIDGSHTGEDRTAIHEDLGILSLETVDTKLGLTAVGACILYPQTRLKIQHIRHTSYRRRLKEFRRKDIHDSSCLLTLRSISVSGHDNTVELLRDLTNHGFEFDGLILLDTDRQFRRLIPHIGEDYSLLPERQILQKIMPRLIGNSTDIRSFYLDVDKGQMLARPLVQHVPYQMGIKILLCP